jgi:hypothetical protein
LRLPAGVVIALALSFGVVILLLVVWSIRRHRDPHLHIDCSSPIEELMPSLAGLTLATAVDGNTVEIFETAPISKSFSRKSGRRNVRCTLKPSCGPKVCSASAWRTPCPKARARACRCVAAGRDRHNDEITLGFKDAAAAKRLEEIFEKYAPRCAEIKLEQWRKRLLWHRRVDNMYYLINEVL